MRWSVSTMAHDVALQETEFETPRPPSAPPDAEAYALESSLRSLIFLGAATSERSQQTAIGASDLGTACDRKLAYQLAHTPPAHITDPLRALVGIGLHSVMADVFRRLDGGSGRFLVERQVRFRGIPGTADLYDRMTHTVVDWKTVFKNKLARLRMDGPPRHYVVQVQTYAAGLHAAGEDVRWCAIAYLPVDGTLDDMWIWRTAFDPTVADNAVTRVNAISELQMTDVTGRIRPSTVEAAPSNLCPWCEHYHKSAVDLDAACPGKDQP